MLLFREQIPWLNDTRNLYPPLSCLQGTKLPVKYSHNYISFFFISYFGPAFRHGTLPSIRGVVSGTMFSHHLGEPSKNVYFMVRLTITGGGSILMQPPPTPKPPYFSLMYHLLVLFFQTAGTAFFAVAIRNSVKPGIGRKSYPYFVLNTIISFIFANNFHLPCKGRKCQHSVLIVQALSEKATMAIWNMSANII